MIASVAFNTAVTVCFAGIGHVTGKITKQMVGEKLTKELGQEAAEKVMKESDNYCRTYLNIDKLQKAGVTGETIAGLSQENLETMFLYIDILYPK